MADAPDTEETTTDEDTLVGTEPDVPTMKMALDDLSLADYNPRGITEEAMRRLRASIEAFGLVDPLIWNRRTGTLVGGHQRVKVLRQMGITHADVRIIDVDEAQEKALNVALNNQTMSGTWDDVGLATILSELSKMDDFDETLTGFDPTEIDRLIQQAAYGDQGADEEGITPPDRVLEVVVECKSETEQQQLYERLTGEGMTCRVLTI